MPNITQKINYDTKKRRDGVKDKHIKVSKPTSTDKEDMTQANQGKQL
jgi:hypothetical protein